MWDYAGDNYVHRLIQSKTDGKLVELNHHCARHYDGFSESAGDDTLDEVEYVTSYIDSCSSISYLMFSILTFFSCFIILLFLMQIKNEYNELLTSQLETQKNVSSLLNFRCAFIFILLMKLIYFLCQIENRFTKYWYS